MYQEQVEHKENEKEGEKRVIIDISKINNNK